MRDDRKDAVTYAARSEQWANVLDRLQWTSRMQDPATVNDVVELISVLRALTEAAILEATEDIKRDLRSLR